MCNRKNKLRTALKYLEKAQRIEMKSRVVANPAGTRLNLCAVLSQLERSLPPKKLSHLSSTILSSLAAIMINGCIRQHTALTNCALQT